MIHSTHTSTFPRLRRVLWRVPPHSARGHSALNRPSPPPLPREHQREFEELQRAAHMPLSQASSFSAEAALHPDARQPLKPDFEGDINPLTGEQGGPKTEPVGEWAEGDWSFKGRVSDF